MLRLYFARHGESRANLIHQISNRGLKHPLTEQGRAQAAALADRLAGQGLTHIYTSPVLRALETTAILAFRLGVDYDVTEALREYDMGRLEGRGDEKTWQTWKAFFDDWPEGRRRNQRTPGGESFHDIEDRFLPFIRGLIARFGESDERLLCLSHGGIYTLMLPLVVRNFDPATLKAHGGFKYSDCLVCELHPEGLEWAAWL